MKKPLFKVLGKTPARAETITTEIDIGDRVVPLEARINRRAKRLIVKVDSIGDRVLVTAPSKRAVPEALRFARTRIVWIREQLNETRGPKPFVEGGDCPFRGIPHRIVNEGPSRKPVQKIDGQPPRLVVGGEAAHLNRRVSDWLKRQARMALQERVDAHCRTLGKTYKRILVRDTRSRWGSCSSDGVLSFSWRLILAPPDILDYVAAHECAHLIHLNHSPAYWRVVASLEVDANAARLWFDRHGAELHAWGVEPAPKRAA